MNGAMRVVAGILLFIPGFITDILGLLLLSPAIRRFMWKAFGPRVVCWGLLPPVGKLFGYQTSPGARSGSKVVDLEEEEFHRDGPKDSPWSSRPDDRDLPKP